MTALGWPTRDDLKAHWPLLAPELIHAAWMIAGAAADSDVTSIEPEVLDPLPRQPRDWHEAYAEELADHPGINLDLAGENPIRALSKRAGLTPAELEVWRWISRGAGLGEVSKALGRRPTTIATLRTRGLWRFRALANSQVDGSPNGHLPSRNGTALSGPVRDRRRKRPAPDELPDAAPAAAESPDRP